MKQKTLANSESSDLAETRTGSLVYPTPLHLFLFTAFAVFAGEVVVMLILAMMQPLEIASEALADGIMLTVLVTPFLYLFLFRPMVLHIAERKAAEEALRHLNTELEMRVEERTVDLAEANQHLREEVEDRKKAELGLQKIERLHQTSGGVGALYDVDLRRQLGSVQLRQQQHLRPSGIHPRRGPIGEF